MSVFDQDTQIKKSDDPHLYRAQFNKRWATRSICNGGYVMAIAARAMEDILPHPHPLPITGYYLDKSEPCDTEIHVESIREGRNVSTAAAKISECFTAPIAAINPP